MSTWIDLIGSYAIGGMILLILLSTNNSVNTSASENLYSGIMQRNITGSADLIEHDIYKIGYRVTGNRFSIADSNQIKFFADLDDNGSAETVFYHFSDKSSLNTTPNPNDFLLKREISGQKLSTNIAVTDFKISYFDSLGQQLNYASLKNQSGMSKIRSLKVSLKCESSELINDNYEAAAWEKTILPKNI